MNFNGNTDANIAAPAAAAIWQGDTGELDFDSRRVFVNLLLGPVLDGTRATDLWAALERNEVLLKSRLHDLFLDLVIDRDQKIAFTRQAETGRPVPILLRRKPLSYIETFLFLFLRQQLSAADSRGERAVVSLSEMREHLSDLGRATTDRAGFERHMNGAVQKALRFGVLRKLRASDERYEISPMLKLLLAAGVVEQMKAFYETDRSDGAVPAQSPADSDDDSDEEDAE